MSTPTLRFPAAFLWGTATASYQIEGAVAEDGRAPSIWDTFSHTAGRIAQDDTGDVACDHYHRWREDLDLLAELGAGAYRFSVAWPRVIPDGTGRVNPAGLDFYDRLVDGLLERGIDPVVTLYHWDLPQALEDRGGWTARSTADAFTAYVEAVADRLGDRVPMWVTLNEPWVAAMLGYVLGTHAPGRRSVRDGLLAGHHLLLAHANAVKVLRSTRGDVGVSLNVTDIVPASDRPEDAAAAQFADQQVNRWFLDPLLLGRYPE
ncbi:MAG: family 1 glycosylhydrolase, partial [Candidatus Limnocylindria bacterium]